MVAAGGASFEAAAGRGDGAGVAPAGAAAPRGGGGAADPGPPGSGVMMLTGGVEDAEGKSIMVVGLPGGTVVKGVWAMAGGKAAMAPPGAAAVAGIAGGMPHDGE